MNEYSICIKNKQMDSNYLKQSDLLKNGISLYVYYRVYQEGLIF